jgi:hypothetical protein
LVPEHREPPPLTVGQPHTAAAQLRFQNPVLLAQEGDDIALLSLKPCEERSQQQVKRDD